MNNVKKRESNSIDIKTVSHMDIQENTENDIETVKVREKTVNKQKYIHNNMTS